jgi:peroxiredoxin
MKMHLKTLWNLLPVGRFVLNGVCALALFLTLAGCSAERAPESSFVLLDGSTMTSTQLQGKVSLVNFWATSCTTCVAEMPEIVTTYNKYKDRGYETMAVAMSYDPPSYVVNFAQTRQLPFKVAIDNTGSVARAWGEVQLTPTTFLLNKRGEIVKRYVGAPNFGELHQLIEKLLAES